jgi:hypothetical protein
VIVRSSLVMLAGCLLSGCAALETQARVRASADLRCEPRLLRVQRVGTLRVRPRAPIELALYQAEGCDGEREYFCAQDGERVVCESVARALPWPESVASIEQARRLLRTSSRARCPGTELRVVQESVSLFRYEACDGRWLYHCRRGRCEGLARL